MSLSHYKLHQSWSVMPRGPDVVKRRKMPRSGVRSTVCFEISAHLCSTEKHADELCHGRSQRACCATLMTFITSIFVSHSAFQKHPHHQQRVSEVARGLASKVKKFCLRARIARWVRSCETEWGCQGVEFEDNEASMRTPDLLEWSYAPRSFALGFAKGQFSEKS